jgi:transcriptional regulator with XRE-family HTH domain
MFPEFDSGKELKERRKQIHVGQAELAKQAGVSQSLISAVERGTMPLTGEVRTQLLASLCTFHNKRFEAMPGVQALLEKNKLLEKENAKLKDKIINNLLPRTEKLEKTIAEYDALFREKAEAIGKASDVDNKVEQLRQREEQEKAK